MTTIGAKVAYVKRQGQTRNHHCHWPGCERQVPPAVWGCRKHWYSLPIDLRTAIWKAFRPGQEVKGTPSTSYIAAARAAQDWIAKNYPAARRPHDNPPPAAPASPTGAPMDASVIDRPTTTETAAPAAPTEPGTPFQGGFYAGRLRVGDDVFALIVAPAAGGELAASAWGEYGQDIPAARSFFDGRTNTEAMTEAGCALAKQAAQLDINGFADWYLPSRDELELLYRNLKPTTDTNWRARGDNPSSVPVGYAYSSAAPAQTTAEAFRAGGAEALSDGWYWSSTQGSANCAWYRDFSDGGQSYSGKGSEGRARAVRRFKLNA